MRMSKLNERDEVLVLLNEPDLDGVKEEDRNLVKDVICLLSTLQHPAALCKGWNVNPVGAAHYEVNGLIDTKQGD